MELHLGDRRFDLTDRCLVVGVLDGSADGADLEQQAAAMVVAGADALELPAGSAADHRAVGEHAGVPVITGDAAFVDVPAAHLGPWETPELVAAITAAVMDGVRVVRCTDVTTARRTCDVVMAIIGARGEAAA